MEAKKEGKEEEGEGKKGREMEMRC